VSALQDDGPAAQEARRGVQWQGEAALQAVPAAHAPQRDASKATIAADKQGKFWEMHDLLFEKQSELQTANLDDYAKKIGLDMKRFKAIAAISSRRTS
jgi:protein-disulfide isomerase